MLSDHPLSDDLRTRFRTWDAAQGGDYTPAALTRRAELLGIIHELKLAETVGHGLTWRAEDWYADGIELLALPLSD
jgi:hypothetical protein